MNTYDLFQELLSKDKAEIMACLSVLMAEEKLDFKTLSEAHVVHLESQRKDYNDKLIEAGSTIFDSLVYDRFDKKQATKNSIQRRLYFLNQSGRFNMGELNAKYEYDEEEGRRLSWYERNKSLR